MSEEFTIKDKRRFTPDGEVKAGEEEPESSGQETESKPEADAAEGRSEAVSEDTKEHIPLPEVNFSTFVFSLSTSALMNLGELPDPQTRQVSKNLPLAKQTIDILGMLQEKTKGNLDGEEENLLNNLLYELRMKYVAAKKG
jgi:hypothetical protein